MPNGKYVTEWENYVKLFDVPLKEVDGPSSFTLRYGLPSGMKSRVILLDASYYGDDSGSRTYPAPPSCYTFTNGQVAAVSPIVDDRPALLISADAQVVRGRSYGEKELGGKCILVPDNGDLDFFDNADGAPQRLPLARVSPACVGLGTGITFSYPKDEPLAKGMKWTVPETSRFNFDLPCEIAGFAEVAGRETVKILAERTLSNQDVQRLIARRMRGAKNEARESRVKEAIAENTTMAYHFTLYADLKTGVVMRQEVSLTVTRLGRASDLVAEHAISQVLDG